MRTTALAAAAFVAVSGALAATAGVGPAAAAPGAGPTPLPFQQTLRRCDFTEFQYFGPAFYGRPSGSLRVEGGEVVADILFATGAANTRYDLKLIQVDRPSAQPCNPGDPGVAGTTLFTDAAGAGSATVRAPKAPGATGAWVSLTRPGQFSQLPEEFYTTNFVVPI
ncbi:hypothetical protein FHR72_004229 [Mycolicibacterium iranicum]|uniref:Secreted protein n=1 Tax=Mycolicibacterium iranicum TaxID=912594 RepID=A0A839QE09_MYCIR|nr:hypothetical protein [Mycolicibacterium iranicum]MBB2992725.1 hypothetical protein [Mycolicibacterium iranicum]